MSKQRKDDTSREGADKHNKDWYDTPYHQPSEERLNPAEESEATRQWRRRNEQGIDRRYNGATSTEFGEVEAGEFAKSLERDRKERDAEMFVHPRGGYGSSFAGIPNNGSKHNRRLEGGHVANLGARTGAYTGIY